MKHYFLQGLSTQVLAASLAAERSKQEDKKNQITEKPCCVAEECCVTKPQ